MPAGVTGALYLAGAGIDRHHAGSPALTACSFIAHPFAEGRRLYRTGDLAAWSTDGSLMLHAPAARSTQAADSAIDIGRVDALLCAHPAVAHAASVLRENQPGGKQLVSYVITGPGQSVDADELRGQLSRWLPAHVASTLVITAPQPSAGRGARLDQETSMLW